ncbi:dihydroorotate oxidase [Blastococcus sp. CT_GayMR20]|uniref:dihydroorotate oxidase n=1 Tax=Blastococcus sp. CT_GayMR20 TaxID=2559609 RepID=UPI001073257B|nr:dihydroorotate oxidase [Blastococcus sp. CT_GayMR20]TFV90238.1 dihydroorotate oxidase [Blastococcus sp. CT_GayMR20]
MCELGRLLFRAGRADLLERHGFPFPRYDFRQDLKQNESGPFSGGSVVDDHRAPAPGGPWTVLGQPIGVPIGIPACPLTMNARWVSFYARQGFNLLTYKTVRSVPRPALPDANWYFADTDAAPWEEADIGSAEVTAGPTVWPRSAHRFSTVNSFGVPSHDPAVWQPDVRRAMSALDADQLLLLSVMGNFEDHRGEELASDFARTAVLGAETGVRAIELNLSCPNGVADGRPLPAIYLDGDSVRSIVGAVRAALGDSVALVVKVGYMPAERLRLSLGPVAHLVDGVAGINALQLPVRDPTRSRPTFPGRLEAGVSGHPIGHLAVDFVRGLAALREDVGVAFDILAMGGATGVDEALRLFDAGATAVQSASGAFFNPLLADELAARVDRIPQGAPAHEAHPPD